MLPRSSVKTPDGIGFIDVENSSKYELKSVLRGATFEDCQKGRLSDCEKLVKRAKDLKKKAGCSIITGCAVRTTPAGTAD